VAVTKSCVPTVTEQVVFPVHAPLQPANVEPVAGVAARVTAVPLAYTPVHSVVQLPIAELGLLLTFPEPFTMTVTSGGSFHPTAGV
jgi:hypothetical protein